MKHTGLRRLVRLSSILLGAGWLIAGAIVFQAQAQPGGVEVRPGPRVQSPLSCWVVAAADVRNVMVTARETATGRTFQFKVDDLRLVGALKIGQSVGADFQAQMAWIPPLPSRYRIVTAQAPVPGTLSGVKPPSGGSAPGTAIKSGAGPAGGLASSSSAVTAPGADPFMLIDRTVYQNSAGSWVDIYIGNNGNADSNYNFSTHLAVSGSAGQPVCSTGINVYGLKRLASIKLLRLQVTLPNSARQIGGVAQLAAPVKYTLSANLQFWQQPRDPTADLNPQNDTDQATLTLPQGGKVECVLASAPLPGAPPPPKLQGLE